MEFSEKLKTLRAEANLTQNQLADQLMISRQAISNYEQGRGYPSIDILVEISKVFQTNLDELLSTGIRRRQIKYVLVLVGLLFLGNTVNLLSLLFIMQRPYLCLSILLLRLLLG